MHGYYSKIASESYGSCFYSDTNGKEVEVTGVYNSVEQAEEMYKWADKVCVGEVVKYLREGALKPGNLRITRSLRF